MYLNDQANSRTYLEKPVFLLYFGNITQLQTIERLMTEIGEAWQKPELYDLDKPFAFNVVIVACGFSETVLGDLGVNFKHPHCINVLPITIPKTGIQNSEMHLLYDLAAVTGATVFDPMSNPIENAKLSDLGYGITGFEMTRYRSSILGVCDEDLIFARQEEIKRMLSSSESKLDTFYINDRVAKLSGGVAKLKVTGPSNGELREKRDRAEDAVFAVRGAAKHGCLPGGGWTLFKLSQGLKESYPRDSIITDILAPALLEPIKRIYTNAGLNVNEANMAMASIGDPYPYMIYDAWEGKQVDAVKAGLLDSVPAVLEAIRSSMSIASLLGTLGGTVVFKRDDELERQEASETNQFMKAYNGETDG
jgi:chaperonin GroEL